MPVYGKIGDGVSSWAWRPITNFLLSFEINGEQIDIAIPTLIEDSKVSWRREVDAWIWEGVVKFIEGDFSKIKQGLNMNLSSWDEKDKFKRLIVYFEGGAFSFLRSNSDILNWDIRYKGEWSNEVFSFIGVVEWKIILRRDANLSLIWIT